MYSISIPKAGGYSQLQVTPIDAPTKGANIKGVSDSKLVVVKTSFVGVNYADIVIRLGLYASAKKYVGWPIVPGFEFSGIVDSVGSEVKDFRVGDKVIGCSMFGSYSSWVSVPENQLFKLPDSFTLENGAGFLTVALTAWYAAFELAQIKAGQTVLVHSAAGGVGSILVQLAAIAGCRVVGVVGSSHKVQYCLDLGCHHVIDRSTTKNIWTEIKNVAPKGFEAVFDANGPSTMSASYNHLAPTGRLIVYGMHSMMPKKGGKLGIIQIIKLIWSVIRVPKFSPMDMIENNKGVLGFNLSFLFEKAEVFRDSVDQMIRWVAEGKLKLPNTTVYPMKNVAEAHQALESGQTIGKLVLQV